MKIHFIETHPAPAGWFDLEIQINDSRAGHVRLSDAEFQQLREVVSDRGISLGRGSSRIDLTLKEDY